jgi:hypothetical protein
MGVASAAVGAELVLLATDQPMPALARRLERGGYRLTGDGVYVPASAKRRERFSAVGLAPGLVVLSDGADEASAALARTAADAPTATKLEQLNAIPASLRALRSDFALDRKRAPCVHTVVGGHDLAGPAGTLILHLTGPGRAGRVLLGSAAQRSNIRTRSYQPRDISVSGSTVSMQIVNRPGALDDHNAATIADSVEPQLVYRCG